MSKVPITSSLLAATLLTGYVRNILKDSRSFYSPTEKLLHFKKGMKGGKNVGLYKSRLQGTSNGFPIHNRSRGKRREPPTMDW
jgi:hypothetical protein